MEFYCNFLIEYSLIDIVKPKFTRRNEMRCRILEIEDLSKNLRKTQDRTSLNCQRLWFDVGPMPLAQQVLHIPTWCQPFFFKYRVGPTFMNVGPPRFKGTIYYLYFVRITWFSLFCDIAASATLEWHPVSI